MQIEPFGLNTRQNYMKLYGDMYEPSRIPLVVETSLNPVPPRSVPDDATPRSSNTFFAGWTTGYTEPRDLAAEDSDENMSSTSSQLGGSFDATSPLTTGAFMGMGGSPPAWFSPPSPRLERVDSGGLSAIAEMNLRDGTVSPLPPLGPVDEVAIDGDEGMDMFEMELPSAAFVAPVDEDAVMSDFSFNYAVPPTSSNIPSSSGPLASAFSIYNDTNSRAFPGSTPRASFSQVDGMLGRKSSKRSRDESDAYLRPTSHRRAGSSSSAALAVHPASFPFPEEPPEPEKKPNESSDEAHRFGIQTALRLERTCKRFFEILGKEDQWTDETFWLTAARQCWKHLPAHLSDVQGRQTCITSWRNVVAVFMRSENGQFGTKRGAKGGVDCFGGKKACRPASSWEEEKRRRLEIEQVGRRPRKLLLVCAQPGPGAINVTTDEHGRGHTISLSLRGGEYLVHIDEYSRFGASGKLPENLARSDNEGYFAPDIFYDRKDRFRLCKVAVQKTRQGPQVLRPRAAANQESVTWDLSSIREYVLDPKAYVARCTHHERLLVCSLFTHRNPTEIDELVDPPEDNRIFCIEGTEVSEAAPSSNSPDTSAMSSKQRGKLPETNTSSGLKWMREFEYRDATAYTTTRRLHYVICNLRMTSANVVALVRWNETTPQSMQQMFDREFHILDSTTGVTLRTLEFPNLFWDFRHHDMHRDYNLMRVSKLNALYNPAPSTSMGSGNRSTRIHGDAFFLSGSKIISGSHDYCNWVWDLTLPEIPRGVYNADHNDGGIVPEPFEVLDDYYWNSTVPAGQQWEPSNERAGWWVKTPNQVLCFWHGAALGGVGVDSPGGTGGKEGEARYFAVCRPGRMFVWDLLGRNEVVGYTNVSPGDSERKRWLGRKRGEKLRGWYTCDDVLPEQGLWLWFEDGEAVFLDAGEILEAAGLQGEQWTWSAGEEGWGWQSEEEEMEVDMDAELEDNEDEYGDRDGDEEMEMGVVKRRRTGYEC
ncbi:hypothetical protein FPQ18DRAFT_383287 [Pyronema domesticum]|nr:hypothetical protein FPQ18DRAFT_383287 [Pyronema domesticum]